MSETVRQKITFAEMRASGVRGLLIYCADYQCSHWIAVNADQWPDDMRLSDLEPKFTCQACGKRGVWMSGVILTGKSGRCGRRGSPAVTVADPQTVRLPLPPRGSGCVWAPLSF
jgi:hypothetical protein